MDNINPITQADLAKYMGLTKDAAGTAAGDVCDASGSKKMEVDNANANQITYKYRRGGVTLQAVINVATQTMTWSVDGVTKGDPRHTALREGLKLASDADLGDSGVTW